MRVHVSSSGTPSCPMSSLGLLLGKESYKQLREMLFMTGLVSVSGVLGVWYGSIVRRYEAGRESHQVPPGTCHPRVQGARPRVQGTRPRVQGARPRVQGARPRVQGTRPRVQGACPRVQGARPRVQGACLRVQGGPARNNGRCVAY